MTGSVGEQIYNFIKLPKVNGISDLPDLTYLYSERTKDKGLEQLIIDEYELDETTMNNTRYYYNYVDLNNDGNYEIFVYIVGPYVCGTGGCSALLVEHLNGNYKVISKFSLVNNPIVVSHTMTDGYRDLIMFVAGGGIESFYAVLKYDGAEYPSNPSIQPEVDSNSKIEGTAIIANDIGSSSGINL